MAALASPSTASGPDSLTAVRHGVRALLEESPEFRSLEPDQRQRLAAGLVRVCHVAEELRREEGDAAGEVAATRLATAQAQPDFGAAAQQAATVTQRILNAVSFPRFVTDLLNGVFK